MIPLGMVESVVYERRDLYNHVQTDIAHTWGSSQSMDGVALLIPYTERFNTVEVVTDSEGKESKKNKTVYKNLGIQCRCLDFGHHHITKIRAAIYQYL